MASPLAAGWCDFEVYSMRNTHVLVLVQMTRDTSTSLSLSCDDMV